jgi:hypothetical protein
MVFIAKTGVLENRIIELGKKNGYSSYCLQQSYSRGFCVEEGKLKA